MLTLIESNTLRELLASEAFTADDVAQLRPGACSTWETSLLLVTQAGAHQVRGQILRPHRSGCREAWARYSPAELVRIGRAAFPEPARAVRAWCYEPACPLIPQRKEPALDTTQRSTRPHRRAG
jgi:hypothetical protein